MNDLHALITELADELDHIRQCLLDDRRLTHPLADKARAALAEPEPEEPTTGGKKPLSLVCDCYMKGMPPNPHQDWHAYFDHCAATGTISGLRLEAIQPTPSVNESIPYSISQQTEPEGPTDKDLLEINYGAYFPGTDEVNDEDNFSWQYTSDYIRWLDENGTPKELKAYTAKGLRAVFKAGRRWGRLAPALQPIPVTERLPGAEDCIANPRDGQGQWCWGWCVDDSAMPFSGRWRMIRRQWLADEAVAWLPAHALPLPQ